MDAVEKILSGFVQPYDTGYLSMSDQILDSISVVAPKQQREGRSSRRTYPTELAGQASKAVSQRPPCTLTTKVYQSEAAGRRDDPCNSSYQLVL